MQPVASSSWSPASIRQTHFRPSSKANINPTSPPPKSCAQPTARCYGCSITRRLGSWGRSHKMIELVPSILSADFTRLGEQVREPEAAGAHRIQIDVMDGHFVPNITMGPIVVEAVRRFTNLTLQEHLMIQKP